jgi:hypothetical protein
VGAVRGTVVVWVGVWGGCRVPIRAGVGGKHTENAAYQHCAKVEVEAFAIWLEKTLNA